MAVCPALWAVVAAAPWVQVAAELNRYADLLVLAHRRSRRRIRGDHVVPHRPCGDRDRSTDHTAPMTLPGSELSSNREQAARPEIQAMTQLTKRLGVSDCCKPVTGGADVPLSE